MTLLTVGQVAEKTGVSVKTLHHYDRINLLSSPHRSEAGYRLYGRTELTRLKQILLLKSLGFNLAAIKELIGNQCDLGVFIEQQIEYKEQQLLKQRQELAKLNQLKLLHNRGEQTIEVLLNDLEKIAMHEKYFSKQQMQILQKRAEEYSNEKMEQAHQEWPRLIAEVQDAVEQGAPVSSEQAQSLALRWNKLIDEFTGGDPEMHDSLAKMYQGEPDFQAEQGMTPEVMAFIHKAIESLQTN
ncbi:MAG: MerR family transcriptional regulator [Kangiellaceae bacterium]|nr:MerR family transcriptional regulator [Kangiellaceae bacterium]MCW8999091.1 MerR family transcriptional regulator [Kangiellaceae bacterium]MCW9015472.1 MerR family transcriptional regulator [Kangiellaceae bacterium]